MSCFRLPKIPKKLLPSKKACKSFISTLTTHLCRLHRPKTRHHHLYHNPTSSPGIHRLRHRGHQYANTIYVDRLYPVDHARPETLSVASTRKAEAVASDAHGAPVTACQERGGGKGKRWKEYLESLPPIRGVDERAEEFITSFRQQMKIEREQSLLDFQEMLARSK